MGHEAWNGAWQSQNLNQGRRCTFTRSSLLQPLGSQAGTMCSEAWPGACGTRFRVWHMGRTTEQYYTLCWEKLESKIDDEAHR